MQRLAWIIVVVLATSIVAGQETARPAPGADVDCSKIVTLPGRTPYDCEHTKWIASVLYSIQAIRPGMTRRELLAIFTTEGGLSTPSQRTYVYKLCPYIKGDVEFTTPEKYSERPDDRIVKISRPYLEYSVMD